MTERICPVCGSPLTTDAVRAGRCQCCGSELPGQPEESTGEQDTTKQSTAETEDR